MLRPIVIKLNVIVDVRKLSNL